MNYPSFDTVKNLRFQLKDVLIKNWLGDTYLHWQWWFLILLVVLPWVIWWKFVNKQKIHQILLFGLIILILNAFLDDIGTGSVWWFYPHKIIPVMNIMKPPDYSIIPCAMMLLFQHFRTWKSFFISNFLMSLVFSQIGERLFIWLGLYQLVSWTLWYSIIHYNVEGLIARLIVLKVDKIHSKEQ